MVHNEVVLLSDVLQVRPGDSGSRRYYLGAALRLINADNGTVNCLETPDG